MKDTKNLQLIWPAALGRCFCDLSGTRDRRS